MIPNEPLLAQFVREFGDQLIVFFTENIYKNDFIYLIIYISAIFMICSIPFMIEKGRFSHFIMFFWLGWISIFPYKGKPTFYVIINTLSVHVSSELEKMVVNIMKKLGGTQYPPGYVYNTIFRSFTARLESPELKSDIDFIINNCIPNGKNNEGNQISAADLFIGKYLKDEISPNESIVNFNFPASELNNLSNRKFDVNGHQINCKNLVISTRNNLRAHIENKNILEMPNLPLGWNNSTFDKSGIDPSFKNTALNLAEANSIQAHILERFYGKSVDGSESLNPSIDMTRSMQGDSMFNPTRITFSMMKSPAAIGRYFNIDNFFDTASGLYEINQRFLNLPYYLSYIQVILKVLVIILLITLFFGTWKFVSLWVSCWILTLNVPWLIMLCRILTNSLMLHILKIKEVSKDLGLKSGVDFSAATNVLHDTSRAMNVFINCEKTLIGSLFLIIPAASWFAAGKIPNFINSASGFATGAALKIFSDKAANKTASIGKAVAKGAIMMVPGAGKAGMVIKSATLANQSKNIGNFLKKRNT